VRDMFAQAKKAAPSIIFIDEIESIGRMRGTGFSGGHDEREQTLNQILVEMDGFSPNDHVIVIGASNRPDMLDPALVRPGRFDRRVVLSLPDLEERKAIVKLHMTGKPFEKDVSIERIARRIVGFSGADIANMLNEAAILAAREGKTAIDNKDLEEAATKEKLGPQRKRMQSDRDRKLAAYHEAGHAIVGHFLKNVDPVHRISIVSRGMSGGHTLFPPTEDRSNETKIRLLEQISAALGGRAAEEVFLNDISTGAGSDIEAATNLARAMVTQYGMSTLGPINLESKTMFGAWKGMDEGPAMSEELHARVDREVGKILDTAYKQALVLVKAQRVKLEAVAKELLEKETLESEEFEKIAGKKKMDTTVTIPKRRYSAEIA
jgi:cell division protease FtsH